MTPEPPRNSLRQFWEGTVRFVEETVPSLAVFVMFLAVMYQVVMRDLFTRPPTWADEMARYLYIYMVLLGAAHISRKRAHISMDYLPVRLHGRSRTLLLLVHEAANIALLVYVLWSGIVFYDFYAKIPSPAMEMPSAYLVIVVPIACVLMLIHHSGTVLDLMRSLRSG